MIVELMTVEGGLRPGIEDAPVDMRVSETKQAIFTIICAVPAVLVLAMTIKAIAKDRNYIWPVFLIGGTVGMVVEPIYDYMGGVWWPIHGDWEAYNLLDVNVPLLVCFVYPWLLGGQAYMAFRAFERGITMRELWLMIGFFAVNDIVLETIGLKALEVYKYFGEQPLNPWGLPLWYVPCNAIGPVLAGALFYVLRRRLVGVHSIMGAVLMPMGYVGTYAMIAFPCWISLNSNWGMGAATGCGLATFVLGYVLVLAIAEMTGTGRPHEDEAPTRRSVAVAGGLTPPWG